MVLKFYIRASVKRLLWNFEGSNTQGVYFKVCENLIILLIIFLRGVVHQRYLLHESDFDRCSGYRNICIYISGLRVLRVTVRTKV